MGFAEQFVAALGSSNLRDDALHHDLDVIAASALAGGFGSLLCRVKYAVRAPDICPPGGNTDLALLLRLWEAEVRKKGEARRWIRVRSERDVATAYVLYRRVARASLAYWLDGLCEACQGTGLAPDGAASGPAGCRACGGSGHAAIACSGGFERERIRDMISELEQIAGSHAGRAMALLKKKSA